MLILKHILINLSDALSGNLFIFKCFNNRFLVKLSHTLHICNVFVVSFQALNKDL